MKVVIACIVFGVLLAYAQAALYLVQLPEENVSHVRVARSPQFFRRHRHGGFRGGDGYGGGPGYGGYPGGGGFGGSQSQATAQSQSFNFQGPFGGGFSGSSASANSASFGG